MQLRNLADHISHIQSATYEGKYLPKFIVIYYLPFLTFFLFIIQVAQRGEELVQHFENSGINIMADNQCNGTSRVQVLLEYLQVFFLNSSRG